MSTALQYSAGSPARRRWFRFSLRGLFVFITVLCLWLGRQVRWMDQRQEARQWIIEHESGGHAARDGVDDFYFTTEIVNGTRVTSRVKTPDAPWSLRVFGEPRLPFIFLDKAKLSVADIARIDSLNGLFPEAKGVHVDEPGWCLTWPPKDPVAFLKYPTRYVEGRLINEPPAGNARQTR